MTAVPSAEVEASGSAAAKRAHGSSFYAAMRIMPPGQREAMFEIYSFCRAVDDIADDQGPAAGRRQGLQQWRDDLDAVYRGQHVAGLEGLAVAVKAFDLRQEDFLAIVDGMEMDVLQNIQAPDFETFDLYCDRVASAVGRLSVRVFGLPEAEGLELSEHLGRALQITNILRDLDEDAAMQRLYLPREFLEEAGIASRVPQSVLADPRLTHVGDHLVKLARERFLKADAIMNAQPRRVVRTPRVMAEAYKTILAALVARGWQAPRAPVRLQKSKLALILVRHLVF